MYSIQRLSNDSSLILILIIGIVNKMVVAMYDCICISSVKISFINMKSNLNLNQFKSILMARRAANVDSAISNTNKSG